MPHPHIIDEEFFRVITSRIRRQTLAMRACRLCLSVSDPDASLLNEVGQDACPRQHRPGFTHERVAVLGGHTLEPVNARLQQERSAGRRGIHGGLDALSRNDRNRRRCAAAAIRTDPHIPRHIGKALLTGKRQPVVHENKQDRGQRGTDAGQSAVSQSTFFSQISRHIE